MPAYSEEDLEVLRNPGQHSPERVEAAERATITNTSPNTYDVEPDDGDDFDGDV